MTYQLAIDFDTPPAPPRARKRDPATSHAAASSAVALRSRHQVEIVAALDQFGPLGKDGIARMTGLTGVQVCRRLAELARDGKVSPTGFVVASDSGRHEREWRLER